MATLSEDLELRGTVSMTGQFYPPAGSINSTHFSAATQERLEATKVTARRSQTSQLADDATTVLATDQLVHIVRGATGDIVGFEAAAVTVPAGGDYSIDIDLQKSTGGGAFATVLSSPITISSSSTNLTAIAATLSSTSLVDGDILKIVVTVAGSTGTQGSGLLATLTFDEAPT